MEVKMWAFVNIVILIVLFERSDTEAISRSIKETIVIDTNDGAKQCTTKLRTCKMKLPDGSLIGKQGDRGEKGEKGSPGLNGIEGNRGEKGNPGDKGDRGYEGMAGSPGSNGTKGDPGEKGDPGLNGSPGLNGTHGNHGEKGDKGDPGLQGPMGLPGTEGTKGDPGQMGDKGLPGMAGSPGSNGTKGDPGKRGDPGLNGSPGLNGTHGNHGEKGDKGDPGLQGPMGLSGTEGTKGDPGQKGDKGIPGPSTPGPIGPPGLPGTPGVCACEPAAPVEDYGLEGDTTEFGTESKPATVACKYGSKDIESGKVYYFYTEEPFKAYCNTTANMATCIVPEKLSIDAVISKSINYKDVENPFWLTTQGVDIKDIYGLTTSHIKWLQKQSVSVTMTLRYHCKNSIPFPRKDPKNDPTKAMKMLTWSELLIGPYPSETTPFFYSMPLESDKCQDSDKFKSEWRHSDIILRSPNVNRLPIQDFYITDIRNEDQSLYIELIELCFA